MQTGNVEKAASPGGGGGTGGDGAGTHYIWSLLLPDHLLQLPGASSCSRGQKLSRSGAEPQACHAEVGTADSGVDKGGSECPKIGTDLLGSGAIGLAIRVRDMGPDTAYAEVVG